MTDSPKQALGDLAGAVSQSKAASWSQPVSQPFTPKSITQLAGSITEADSLIEARDALARSSAASALASPGAPIAIIDLEAFPGHQVGTDAVAAPEAAAVPWPAMSTPPRLDDPPRLRRPLSAPRTTPSIEIEAAEARNANYWNRAIAPLPNVAWRQPAHIAHRGSLPHVERCNLWKPISFNPHSRHVASFEGG
jgi:hypothetical protein